MEMPEEVAIPEHKHELLAESIFGMMSTIRARDGLISTNPVGYVWDGQRIRVSSLKSRIKYQNLLADPRITFCVISSTHIMNYVEIRGHATLEDDLDRSFSREQFMRASAGEEPPEDMDPPDGERIIITIHPQQVSAPTLYGGRFDERPTRLDSR